MSTRRSGPKAVVLAALLAISMVACGGDGGSDNNADGDDQDPPAATSEQGGASTTLGDTPDDAGGGSGGDPGPEFQCTVTAEQVSGLLGVDLVKNEELCTFTRDGLTGQVPSAGFLPQFAELCNEEFAFATGYTERVEGLDVEAFLRVGGGTTARVLVCADAAFEVYVDTGADTATGIAVAETLALFALEG